MMNGILQVLSSCGTGGEPRVSQRHPGASERCGLGPVRVGDLEIFWPIQHATSKWAEIVATGNLGPGLIA